MMHRLSEPIKARCLSGKDFAPPLWRNFFALGMGMT
jgi:hypothetical protein